MVVGELKRSANALVSGWRYFLGGGRGCNSSNPFIFCGGLRKMVVIFLVVPIFSNSDRSS